MFGNLGVDMCLSNLHLGVDGCLSNLQYVHAIVLASKGGGVPWRAEELVGSSIALAIVLGA